MPLDSCAAQLEFDVLQVGNENAHLPRDVETHGRRLLQLSPDGLELIVCYRHRGDLNGLFLDLALLLIGFRKCDGDGLRRGREARQRLRGLILGEAHRVGRFCGTIFRLQI